MKKDEFIGVRVSKEVKERLRKEAEKQGMSISQYFESRIKGNFEEPKLIVQALISNAKESKPKYWKKADQWEMTRALEWQIPIMVSDFVAPQGAMPDGLPMHMSYLVGELYKAVINNIDSLSDFAKASVSTNAIRVGEILGENINKLKGSTIDEQKQIISELKDMIETIVFHFAATAFDKEAYQNIRKELDKVADKLITDLEIKKLEDKQSEASGNSK